MTPIVVIHMAEGVLFFLLGMVVGYGLCCIVRTAVMGKGSLTASGVRKNRPDPSSRTRAEGVKH